MLGKRFRRTTSMSHLGPGTTAGRAATPLEKTQAEPTPHSVPPKAARPNNLISQAQSDFEALEGQADACYVDMNMASVFEAASAQILRRPACHANNGVVDQDDARMQKLAVAGWEDDILRDSVACYGDAASMQKPAGTCHSDAVLDDQSAPAVMRSLHAGVVSCFQEQSRGSSLMPYQMGLWINNSSMQGSHGLHGKLEQTISPVDFLDVCFYCKRRLRHERDIFIYRGDTAFCSEECRHRQIVNDERRSSRANNNGSKRSGGARPSSSSSETAVAA